MFRKIIDASNFKNVEEFALNIENIYQTLNFIFPYKSRVCEHRSASREILKPNDFLELKSGKIVKVVSPYTDLVEVEQFFDNYSLHPRISGAIEIKSLILDRVHRVEYSEIKRKLLTVTGYTNPFTCLNFAKFKVPARVSKAPSVVQS